MTTSPSTTQRSGSAALSGVGQLREVAVERLEVALWVNTSSPSRKTIARKPSHFGSNSQPSPVGSPSEAFASIGSSGGSKGSFIPRV